MMTQQKKVTIKTSGDKIARGEKIVGMECHDTLSAIMAEDAADIVKLIKCCIDAGISTVLLEHASEELANWCYENLPVPIAGLGSGP